MSCVFNEFEILCNVCAGTPGRRDRGELPTTSEAALTASSSVTLNASLTTAHNLLAAKASK